MAAGPRRPALSRTRLDLRVVVLGAGSVGCFIGGCWKVAGLDVRLIGRERLQADVEQHGLALSDYSGWQAGLLPGQVYYRTEPDALADADIIALCVKSGATADAARLIAARGKPGAAVISFQNGISNVDVLARELGDRFAVVRGMVPYNVAYLGKGHFHKGVAGDLCADDGDDRVRMLAREIGHSPAQLQLADDMLGLAWGKLLINLNNAVNALSGRTLLDQLRQRDYRRVVAASQREGLALLDRAGIVPAASGGIKPHALPKLIDTPNLLFNNVFLKKWKVDAKARSSMADDLAQGRTTEVDYINGELVALAERLGTDAPVNRKIVALIRAAEAGAQPWEPAALRHAVLG